MPEQDDRARAVHRLSEMMTVVVLNLPVLQEAIERGELAEALRIVGDMRAATADSVTAFDRLRRSL